MSLCGEGRKEKREKEKKKVKPGKRGFCPLVASTRFLHVCPKQKPSVGRRILVIIYWQYLLFSASPVGCLVYLE
jgi:hypothetical protein